MLLRISASFYPIRSGKLKRKSKQCFILPSYTCSYDTVCTQRLDHYSLPYKHLLANLIIKDQQKHSKMLGTIRKLIYTRVRYNSWKRANNHYCQTQFFFTGDRHFNTCSSFIFTAENILLV